MQKNSGNAGVQSSERLKSSEQLINQSSKAFGKKARAAIGLFIGCAVVCAAFVVSPVMQAHAATTSTAATSAAAAAPAASGAASTSGTTQNLNSIYKVTMTQSPANPVSAGQTVTYTYQLTDTAFPGTRFANATSPNDGGLILTDSACPAANMKIVSGIQYYHPGYGTLLSGGTATLQCSTTYPSAQKVTHQLTVQSGVLNFDAPIAQLPVPSATGTYPSALNPYQTVVNPPTVNTGDFQLGQRVESNPVKTGSTEKIVLSIAHSNTDSIYGKPLTVTYQLPGAAMRITGASATNGGACSVNSAANTVTCTYPASAFGPSATSQISISAIGAAAGVAHPSATISSPGTVTAYNSVNSTSIAVVAPTNTNTPGTSAQGGVVAGSNAGTGAGSSDLGTYSLTATASTNYISAPTTVTYTYVIKNNSARDFIATPANAPASSVLSDPSCSDIAYGAGWGDVDGHKTIAPGESATIVCTASVNQTTTNTAATHGLTFASKDEHGAWNWSDAALAPISANVTVENVGRANNAGNGTATDEDMPDYISSGVSLPISCAVPSVWTANGGAVATTSLFHQWQGDQILRAVATSGTYSGPGAYWQWNLGGTNLPYAQTSYWTGSGSNAFKPVSNVGYSYGALAYNPQNHLLYALTNSDSNIRSGQVITIDANGTIRRTGVYLPYPTWNASASTGDQSTAKEGLRQLQSGVAPYSALKQTTGGFNAGFFDDSGNYYVASGTGTGNLYKIDPLTGTVSQVLTGTVNSGAWSNDFSYSDGYAYGIENAKVADPATGAAVANPHAFQLEQINLNTGAIKYIALPKALDGAAMRTDSYGASWTYGNGDLGFDSNSGYWYQLRIVNPTAATPTAVMVSDGVGLSFSIDGTACSELPADLSITKAQGSAAKPGKNVTWKVTVKNNGPGVSSGFVVKDAVPAGFTFVSAAFANSSDGTCSYDSNTRTIACVASVGAAGIAAGQSRVITVTATAPTTSTLAAHPDKNCYSDSAQVDGNEADPDAANNTAKTPESCVINSFSVTKTTDSKWIPTASADGTYTVNYTIRVKDTGVTPAYYWQLTDSPDLSNIDVKSVTWSGGPTHAAPTAASQTAAGSGVWNIGSNAKKTLAVGASDTYKVVVRFVLKSGMNLNHIAPCVATPSGYDGGIVNSADAAGETETGHENVSCIQPKVRITVRKLGHNCDTNKLTCPLPGAEFALYNTDPTKPGAAKMADGIKVEANRADFTSVPLEPGTTYWLLETKSPAGHELMAAPIAFSVEKAAAKGNGPAYAITMKDSSALGSGQELAAGPSASNKLELDVYDTTISQLPVTGVPLRIPWLLIGFGLSLIGVGIAAAVRKRKQAK